MINFPAMFFSTRFGASTLWGQLVSNGTVLCAVGRDQFTDLGRIITSTDSGVTWVVRTPSQDAPWTGVGTNGTDLVVVGNNGLVVKSTDNGVTWANGADSNPGISGRRRLAWNGSVYLSVVTGSGAGSTSATGSTWTNSGAFSSAGNWSGVIAKSSRFIVANDSAPRVTTSDNSGASWTNRTTPTEAWGALAANSTVVLLLSGIGSSIAASSGDSGATWTQRVGNAAAWTSAAWTGAVFCAVALDGYSSSVQTTTDAITWTTRAPAVAGVDWQAIAAIGTALCAIGNMSVAPYSSVIQTSTDNGVTWVQQNSP